MDYTQITYEVEDRIARITLNRPKQKNPQGRILLEELDHAMVTAGDDTEVRVVVLAGAGDSFSAGHDLGTPEELADREARPYEDGLRGRYKRSWDLNIEKTLRWRNLPKPTIAAVHGYCVFAGWMIASAMDVIIAADDSKFLGTNFQYFSVPWDIGARRAKELLFESRFIDAHEAAALGLVNRVVPAADLDDEVMDYARRVAANDPFQLRMIKLAINQAQDASGYSQSIAGGHAFHMLSSIGEGDPAADLPDREGKRRRPMVQRAIENQRLAQERAAKQGEA
ncbi:MAG: enoyl-CoA hydratase-related protein [Dehalococcoidia bacterium]